MGFGFHFHVQIVARQLVRWDISFIQEIAFVHYVLLLCFRFIMTPKKYLIQNIHKYPLDKYFGILENMLKQLAGKKSKLY